MSAPGLGTKSCPLARQHSVEQWFSTGWFCFPRQHLKTHQAVTSKGDCAIRVALLETWDVLIILKVHRAAPTTKNFPTHVSSAEDEKPYFREKKKSRLKRSYLSLKKNVCEKRDMGMLMIWYIKWKKNTENNIASVLPSWWKLSTPNHFNLFH